MFGFFRRMLRDEYVDWDAFPRAFKVPRKTMSLPENRFLTTLAQATRKPLLEVRQTARPMRVPSRVERSVIEGIAREQPADVPFVSAFNGYPQAVLRLSETRPIVLELLRRAVQQDKVLLHPDVFTYPTFPILTLRLIIFDSRIEPFIAEALADISNGDVQDFCSVLVNTRQGALHLYEGDNADARQTVSGKFTLWIPRTSAYLFEDVRVPYHPTKKDAELFIRLLSAAAKYLNGIAPEMQDFLSAGLLHQRTVSITGERW